MMKKGISAALSEPKRFLSISRMSQALTGLLFKVEARRPMYLR